MNRYARTLGGLVCAFLGAAAIAQGCSPTPDQPPDDTTTTGPGSGSGGGGGTSTVSTTDGAGGFMPVTSASGAGGNVGCQGGTPDDDFDGDGYTETTGDCNDCDDGVNPDAVDVIAEGENGNPPPPPVDEDCDGVLDNLPIPCDDNLVLDSADPMDAAKAIGLCKYVQGAKWTIADGSPPPVDPTQLAAFHLGHGLLDNLGPKNPPQEGKRLLMVSSGTARKEGHPEYVHRNFDKKYSSNPPFGFANKVSPACPGVKTKAPHDATGLEVEIKAPSNAQGISFDFNFFTFEWPKYICTDFNDYFVAIMTPFPPMQTDGNISFDGNGNPISVNNAFLGACVCPNGPPCFVPPPNGMNKYDCPLGLDVLLGTDFDVDDGNPGWSNGSTGWLRTQAPVEPGAVFTIRFVAYDSSDGMVDSSALIDNWKWSAKPGTVSTDIVPK
jgi:hypothetical protein